MLNEEIVRAGFAGLMTYPPNIRHLRRLQEAYRDAREEKRGLWAIGETNEKDPENQIVDKAINEIQALADSLDSVNINMLEMHVFEGKPTPPVPYASRRGPTHPRPLQIILHLYPKEVRRHRRQAKGRAAGCSSILATGRVKRNRPRILTRATVGLLVSRLRSVKAIRWPTRCSNHTKKLGLFTGDQCLP